MFVRLGDYRICVDEIRGYYPYHSLNDGYALFITFKRGGNMVISCTDADDAQVKVIHLDELIAKLKGLE